LAVFAVAVFLEDFCVSKWMAGVSGVHHNQCASDSEVFFWCAADFAVAVFGAKYVSGLVRALHQRASLECEAAQIFQE